MEFLGELVGWFADAERWRGSSGIPVRVWEHLEVSLLATVAAAVAMIPPAIGLAHHRKGEFAANALVNVGRAVPSFGIIMGAAIITLPLGLGMGFWPTFVALFALALPPIFTNTYTGVSGIEPAVVEAARGMGLRESDIMARVELPLAMPVLLAGLRVATVQVIATATLGSVLLFGGLGRYIVDGMARRDNAMLVAGALLVALLVVVTEVGFGLAERRLLPKGVRPVDATDHTVETALAT